MKKNIAIIAGGYSSEYGVSVRSAEGLYSFMDRERYDVYKVMVESEKWYVTLPGGTTAPIDKNDFSFRQNGATVHFDFAYITIHGTPGEDGLLQGYLDMLRIPYSSCGVLASALSFNKYKCNQYLKGMGITVSDAVCLRRGQRADTDEIIARLGLPVFVKPSDCGSSFGVTKVKEAAQLQPAIETAFREGNEIIIERFIPGTEVTCGCYKTRTKEVVLPLTEVVPANEFFDYGAKYNGESQEITPARIPAGLTEEIQRKTSAVYDFIGAKGLIRVDYIITPEGAPFLLEVNTTPGMTATSFIPQQVRAAGLDIREVMTDIIENE
ncbi:MAG: D-alanine--D-alanine ligase [Tannerella sp.]|jgi:D-alanine-D-alanine ligase|nr:D-alanine--D-alanine ligase [Tannerella sp.]